MLNKCFIVLICAIVIIAIYFPARHARHYEYIDDKYVLEELVISESSNKNNLKACSYEKQVFNNTDIQFGEFYKRIRYQKPAKGKF